MLNARAIVQRIGTWSLAHAVVRLEEYASDYLLYPFMLYRGGPWISRQLGNDTAALGYGLGFATMVALSTAVNLGYLHLYDRLRIDWFGFEAAKAYELRYAAQPKYRRLRPILAAATFTYLATFHSPLFATLALRKRPMLFQMQRRDWQVFAAAVLLGNLGWAGLVTVAIELWTRMVVPLLRPWLG